MSLFNTAYFWIYFFFISISAPGLAVTVPASPTWGLLTAESGFELVSALGVLVTMLGSVEGIISTAALGRGPSLGDCFTYGELIQTDEFELYICTQLIINVEST